MEGKEDPGVPELTIHLLQMGVGENKGLQQVHYFAKAAVAKCHKLGGLDTLIHLEAASLRSRCGAMLLLQALGEDLFRAFLPASVNFLVFGSSVGVFTWSSLCVQIFLFIRISFILN